MKRFPDGARVCFIGDSITAVFEYVAHISEHYMENYPYSKIRIYNSGVSGGTAKMAHTFLKDDTLCHKPTHAYIMFGVNDSMRWSLAEERTNERYDFLVSAYENYKKDLAVLCDALEAENVEITICTPPPYAEYRIGGEEPYKGGYALMLGYAQYCRQFAKERNYPLCDVHSYLAKIMQTEDIYSDDRVHPTPKGQYYIAKCILEHQGLLIGEEKPISEKLKELRDVSQVTREIFGAELMVIRNYELPVEEKISFIKNFLKGDISVPYFRVVSESYLMHKSEQQKYADLTEKLTDELMG